eukprot:7557347-Pyramimonas_sp.AAC.1
MGAGPPRVQLTRCVCFLALDGLGDARGVRHVGLGEPDLLERCQVGGDDHVVGGALGDDNAQ